MVSSDDYEVRSRVLPSQLAEVETIVGWRLSDSIRSDILRFGGVRFRRVAGLESFPKFAISGLHDGDELLSSNRALLKLVDGRGPIALEFAISSGSERVMVTQDGSVCLVDLGSGEADRIASTIENFVSSLKIADLPSQEELARGRGWINPDFRQLYERLLEESTWKPDNEQR